MSLRLAAFKPFLYGMILPVLLLAGWQIAGDNAWISALLFPTPTRIYAEFEELLITGVLWDNLRISLVRAALGFLLGGGLGILAGLLVGLFRQAERALDPSLQMIRMIPHLAVTALFILWFGIGETSKILLVAKGAFFPLYINTFLGIRNTDNKLYEVSRVLGFGVLKRSFLLAFPSALPNLFLGLRLSLGVAWLSLAVAELLGSTEGIGYLMMDARMLGRTAVVFVGILMFATVGKLSDSLIRLIEKRALRWKDSYKG